MFMGAGGSGLCMLCHGAQAQGGFGPGGPGGGPGGFGGPGGPGGVSEERRRCGVSAVTDGRVVTHVFVTAPFDGEVFGIRLGERATEAIDRLHTTAESHNRIIVVETMGRHAGWIALFAGIGGGADYILIPEQPVDYDDVAAAIERRRSRGKNFSVIVASEGCELPGVEDSGELDDFGHVRVENRAVGDTVATEIEKRTGMQTRATVLGYIQQLAALVQPALPAKDRKDFDAAVQRLRDGVSARANFLQGELKKAAPAAK